jgi:hypothetical protein
MSLQTNNSIYFCIPAVSHVYTKEIIINIFTEYIGLVDTINLIKKDDNTNNVFIHCKQPYKNYLNKNIIDNFSNNKPFILYLNNIFGICHYDDKWSLQKN